MTTTEYAEKWFIQNDIPVIKDGRSISIRNEEQGLELELSWNEVQYRAELYLESELHRVKFNNE